MIRARLRPGRDAATTPTVTRDDLEARRAELAMRHRDLDAAIAALVEAPLPDQLRLARMKRQKLALRDQIAWLEAKAIPDIIA